MSTHTKNDNGNYNLELDIYGRRHVLKYVKKVSNVPPQMMRDIQASDVVSGEPRKIAATYGFKLTTKEASALYYLTKTGN